MAFFKKKRKIKIEEPVIEEQEVLEEDTEEEPDKTDAEPDEPEISPDEKFRQDCAAVTKRLRMVFPKNMLIGFYYGEFQSGGYIDDFCCYTTNGKLIEKSDIPKLCGVGFADMVAREERLEKAFMNVRASAPEATGKPCNALSITLLANGKVKLDVTADELIDGKEAERYEKWRRHVEDSSPGKIAAQAAAGRLKKIQDDNKQLYENLGVEFYSFMPGEDFKMAYFYAEFGESGVFFYHRLVTDDGVIFDGDDMFEKYEMDKDEAVKNRFEIIKILMQLRQTFANAKQPVFTTVTLSVTGKGEFRSKIGFEKIPAAEESVRLEKWKETHSGEEEV